jgi:hypothetical protein
MMGAGLMFAIQGNKEPDSKPLLRREGLVQVGEVVVVWVRNEEVGKAIGIVCEVVVMKVVW